MMKAIDHREIQAIDGTRRSNRMMPRKSAIRYTYSGSCPRAASTIPSNCRGQIFAMRFGTMVFQNPCTIQNAADTPTNRCSANL